MFNEKQIELGNTLFARLKGRFPEIRLAGIAEGAENPANLWVNVVMPKDEDRQIQLLEMASEISTDILLDYGYHISIISAEIPDRSAA
jgi:hypothetical protein